MLPLMLMLSCGDSAPQAPPVITTPSPQEHLNQTGEAPDRNSVPGPPGRAKKPVPGNLPPPPAQPLLDPPEGGWPTESPAPGCPEGMARVQGAEGDFCIHRFEAVLIGSAGPKDQGDTWPTPAVAFPQVRSVAGVLPSKGVSWYQARTACLSVGMRLCTSSQWEDACDGQPGSGGRTHSIPQAGLSQHCNVGMGAGDPQGKLHATGRNPGCRTPEGVYDLDGNLWEWTDPEKQDANGLPIIDKRGSGFYSARSRRCDEPSGHHPPSFEGTIGFRCCKSVEGEQP